MTKTKNRAEALRAKLARTRNSRRLAPEALRREVGAFAKDDRQPS